MIVLWLVALVAWLENLNFEVTNFGFSLCYGWIGSTFVRVWDLIESSNNWTFGLTLDPGKMGYVVRLLYLAYIYFHIWWHLNAYMP